MSDKELLLSNIDNIHTTELGYIRIKNNLNISNNIIDYIKSLLLSDKCIINKKGKNYYALIDNIVITINSFNYSVITVHKR